MSARLSVISIPNGLAESLLISSDVRDRCEILIVGAKMVLNLISKFLGFVGTGFVCFSTLVVSGILNPVLADESNSSQVEFPGRIEALVTYDVSNLIDGVITKVHFKPGQFVDEGDVLFSIHAEPFELAVRTRRFNAVKAETTLDSARQDLDRIQKLKNRGSATDVQMLRAEVALSLGEALVEQAKAELAAAEVELSNTSILAPISGVISRSEVNAGGYVKKGRAPLARIDQMDPVRLSYAIPYVERIEQLEIDDLRRPQELLEKVILRIKLSDTWVYSETTKPENVSSRVDFPGGTITIWAEIDNPYFQLRPGMRVKVLPSLATE